MSNIPDLSSYLDYRQYLHDYYDYRVTSSNGDLRPYNYSNFAAAADIRSPNYLKMIIQGERNLSEEMIPKFSKALQHNKEQFEEFKLLVLMNQAKDAAERNQHLRQISELRLQRKLRIGEIDKKIWDSVPNWVAYVLFALADQEGAQFDIEHLRKTLRNKASKEEISAALKSVLDSKFLIPDPESGVLTKNRSLIESTEEIPVALIRKIQGELLYLGLESLLQDDPSEREFGSTTLCLTQEEFEDAKFQLRKLRKSLTKDAGVKRAQNKGERVYQLNIQLFPITNRTNDC